jgi:putative phosphoserine phosphatase/1-acylglycerol-3-phosphate O-acyltransferase
MTRIAAIFDLDDTILRGSSGRLFVQYLRRKRLFSRYFRLRNMMPVVASYLLYRLGRRDATQTMRRSAMAARGILVDDLWMVVNPWIEEVLVPAIAPAAQERLAWHRSEGHLPVICSASSQFAVPPVANYLGIEHVVFTEWLVENGRLTGRVREPVVYGVGKVHWMKLWAAEEQVSLAESYFYSDHISDQPLLELVAWPTAVNPDARLAELALQRGWPVQNWR